MMWKRIVNIFQYVLYFGAVAYEILLNYRIYFQSENFTVYSNQIKILHSVALLVLLGLPLAVRKFGDKIKEIKLSLGDVFKLEAKLEETNSALERIENILISIKVSQELQLEQVTKVSQQTQLQQDINIGSTGSSGIDYQTYKALRNDIKEEILSEVKNALEQKE